MLQWQFSSNEDDDDGDGIGNADELIADTDPNNSNDWFRITAITNATVYFNSSANRQYSLYSTTNLTGNSWIPLILEEPGLGGPDSLSDPSDLVPPNNFYKIEVGITSDEEPPFQ